MQPQFQQGLMYPNSGDSEIKDDGISHIEIDGAIMHLNTKTNELIPLSKCGCCKYGLSYSNP